MSRAASCARAREAGVATREQRGAHSATYDIAQHITRAAAQCACSVIIIADAIILLLPSASNNTEHREYRTGHLNEWRIRPECH